MYKMSIVKIPFSGTLGNEVEDPFHSKPPRGLTISKDGVDDIQCLTSPQRQPCKSLSYALIMSKGKLTQLTVTGSKIPYSECFLPGIDLSIQLNKDGLVIEGFPDMNGNLPIFKCIQPSRRNFMPFWSPHGDSLTVSISISNVIFENIVIPIFGPRLEVSFRDVSFIDAIVLSNSSSCEALSVQFVSVNFTAIHFEEVIDFSPVANVMGLYSKHKITSPGASIYCKTNSVRVVHSVIERSLLFALAYLRLEAAFNNITNSGTSKHKANIWLILGKSAPNTAQFDRVRSSLTQKSDFAVVLIESTDYTMDIVKFGNSSFENGARALHLNLHKLGDVSIEGCVFTRNMAAGKGGALRLDFKQIDNIQRGRILISNSSFTENRVDVINNDATLVTSEDSFSAGGAIFIESGEYNCSLIHQPNIIISNSVFIDNAAKSFGGAIYMGFGIFADLQQTELTYSLIDFHSWSGDLISAKCRVSFRDVDVIVESTNGETSAIDFVPTDDSGFVRPYKLSLQCPPGHSLDLRYLQGQVGSAGSGGAFANLVTFCRFCNEKEYTPDYGYAFINYTDNVTFSVQNNIHSNNVSCLACPYGAECNIGLLRARPGFWGFRETDGYKFQRCPKGYCCNGGSVPCDTHDACRTHRSGILCGACVSGHSESFLSTDCVRDTECNDTWVWPVMIVGALLYLFYYMYKSELVNISFKAFTYIVSKCESIRGKLGPENDNRSTTKPDVTIVKSAYVANVTDNSQGGSRHNSPMGTPLKRLQPLATISRSDNTLFTHSVDSDIYKTKSNIAWTSLLTKIANLDETERKTIMDHEDADGVDRGYLGIITYYAQASGLMRVHIEFKNISSGGLIDTIEEYLVKYLDFDIYQVELKVCPLPGISALFKALLKTFFVVTIYTCWCIMASVTYLFYVCSGKNQKAKQYAKKFHLKLVEGLVEVIKYTFSSLANNNFALLSCVYIGQSYVWKLDGNVSCFTTWQGLAGLFLIFYTVPFSFTLAYGTKLIKEGKISSTHFILSCIVPLPFCFIWLFLYLLRWHKVGDSSPSRHKWREYEVTRASDVKLSASAEVILSVLQGPYRDDDHTLISIPRFAFLRGLSSTEKEPNSKVSIIGSTAYWEGIMELRRLVLNCLTLVNNQILKLTLMAVTCLVILIHHVSVQPFKLERSNRAETLSLSFLLIISALNVVKATFTEFGMIPDGPNEPLLRVIDKAGHVMLFLLICFILLIELYCFLHTRYKKKRS